MTNLSCHIHEQVSCRMETFQDKIIGAKLMQPYLIEMSWDLYSCGLLGQGLQFLGPHKRVWMPINWKLGLAPKIAGNWDFPPKICWDLGISQN